MTAAELAGFGGPEMLQVYEVSLPQPGRREVLGRVSAAAVRTSDVWSRRGAPSTSSSGAAASGNSYSSREARRPSPTATRRHVLSPLCPVENALTTGGPR